MVERVVIRDNRNAPLHYLSDLDAFKNGTEYEFKPGVNVIVGENGSGKTTLLKLIERYLLVDKTECSLGMYGSVMRGLMGLKDAVPDGVGVYADYDKNTFRLCHKAEKNDDDIMSSFSAFGEAYMQMHSSTGEGVNIALNSLFKRMFSEGAKLKFDYNKVAEKEKSYGEYIKNHRVQSHNEWTIILDEPDRNLDIENIGQIKNILSFHKQNTQIIAVVHNPLLLYALSKKKNINFIEFTPGYIDKIKKQINEIVYE